MAWDPLPGKRDPIGLEDSLGRLQRLIGTARPDNLAVLTQHWDQVIGARLASHCQLHSLRHGTLVVGSVDGAVAEQLRWMERDLIAAANAVLGSEEIESVEVKSLPA